MSSAVDELYPYWRGPEMTDADLTAPWREGITTPYQTSPAFRLGAFGIGAPDAKHRLKLAALMKAGAPVADVCAVIRESARAAGRPTDPDAIRAEFLDVWRALHGQGIERLAAGILHTPASRKKPKPKTEEAAALELADLRAARFLDTEPAPFKWLLRDSVPMGMVSALAAAPGSGKTFALLQMGMTVATGRQFVPGFQLAPEGKGKALLVLAEESEAVVHHRLRGLLETLVADDDDALPLWDAIRDRLFIVTRAGKDSRLVKGGMFGPEGTKFYAELKKLCAEIGPDLRLVAVDPWSQAAPLAEKAPEEATAAVGLLTAIAEETGAAVVVSAHTRKAPSRSGGRKPSSMDLLSADEIRGSSALVGAVRAALLLAPLMPHEQKLAANPTRPHDTILAAVVKANHGKPPEPMLWTRGEAGALLFHTGLDAEEVSEAAEEQAALDRVRFLLRRLDKPATPREFCRTYAARVQWRGQTISEARLRGIVDRATAEGALLLTDERHPKLKLPPHAQAEPPADWMDDATDAPPDEMAACYEFYRE